MQAGREYVEAISSIRLGLVKGIVGTLQQSLLIEFPRVRRANSDTDGDRDFTPGKGNRLSQRLDDLSGNPLRHLRIVQIYEQNDKLVASHSGDSIADSYGLHEATGGHAQDLIAGLVAKCIVDLLEVVDIDHQKSQARLMALGRLPCGSQPIIQQ